MNNKPMNESQAISALFLTKKILDELNIEFMLSCGVLLGAVRDGKFIDWDYDIDLGTSEKFIQHMEYICEKFEEAGASTYYSKYTNVIAIYYQGITIDLDFWRDHQNYKVMPMRLIENTIGKIIYFIEWVLLYSPASHANSKNYSKNKVKYPYIRYAACKITDKIFSEKAKINTCILLTKLAKMTGNRRGLVKIPLSVFEHDKTINFYNTEFKIPSDTEKYLETYYGIDWKTPKREWEYISKSGKINSPSQVNNEVWHYKCFS